MNDLDALVVFYSRTGHTGQLARKIADVLGGDLFKLTTSHYATPFFGYMRAGKDSLTGVMPPLDAVPELGRYDLVALGSPIWTSYPSTPMRAFLSQGPALPERTGMFLSSGGPGAHDKAFAMANALMGRTLRATMALAENEQNTPLADHAIDAFCKALIRG